MKTQHSKTALLLVLFASLTSSAFSQTPVKVAYRSSFSDEGLRNPFWPIGWQKTDPTPQIATQGPALPISPDLFNVSSISISSSPLAVINGRSYGEGEVIDAIYNGQRIKILVVRITDGDVTLQYMNRKFVVSQRRLDMTPKHSSKDDVLHDTAIILR